MQYILNATTAYIFLCKMEAFFHQNHKTAFFKASVVFDFRSQSLVHCRWFSEEMKAHKKSILLRAESIIYGVHIERLWQRQKKKKQLPFTYLNRHQSFGWKQSIFTRG